MTVEKNGNSSAAEKLQDNSRKNTAFPWSQRRFLRIGAVLTAALLAIAIGLLAEHWPYSEQRVAQAISQEFSGEVKIGHFRTLVFPHPGGVAEDVEFRWATKKGEKVTLATVKKLTVESHYLDFVFRPGHVSHLILDGLKIGVPALGSGVRPMDIPNTATGTRVGEVIANDAVIEVARKDDGPLKFEIHSVRLKNLQDGKPFSFEMTLKNPLPPGEIEATGSFGPWNTKEPERTNVSGRYFFDAANLEVFHGIAGMLSSDGEVEGPLGQMNAKGRIDIPNFEVRRSEHEVPLTCEYNALVNGINGDVTLQQVNGVVLKTRFAAKGTIAGHAGAGGKVASIDLGVDQGRIQDVLRIFSKAPKPPLNGATGFRAHVLIPPGNERFLKRVILVGDFGVADARFTKPKTQESVAELSARGAGKKPEEVEQDPDDLVSDLSGHVELRNGIATFTDFQFTVPDANATMHGTYDVIDEKVDLHGILRTTAKFSQTTSGFKSAVLKLFDPFFKRKRGGGKIPVQLTGTYSDPHPGLELIR